MDHFHRIAASLTVGAMALAIPASSLALGLGFNVRSQSNSEISAGSMGAGAAADAKVEARCSRFTGAERTECEAGVRAYLDARADTFDARLRMRTVIRNIRDRVHGARQEGKQTLARVRVFLAGLRSQLHAALNTEAEAAVSVCRDKEGAEHDTCIAAAKVKLQAKVNAAIEAMKR